MAEEKSENSFRSNQSPDLRFKATFVMYTTGGGGGGQMILRGDLNFFGKEQGGMSRFFIIGRGGANFFL